MEYSDSPTRAASLTSPRKNLDFQREQGDYERKKYKRRESICLTNKRKSLAPGKRTPFHEIRNKGARLDYLESGEGAVKKNISNDKSEEGKGGEDASPANNNRIEPVSNAALADLYSQCIKLATANKINQKNTWTLKLIDHMDECVLSRDEKGQLNFQKASCTLDASVQIYSSRVDSVHQSTYKVLGGLSKGSKEKKAQEDEEDADDDDEVRQRKANRRAARRRRGAKTLESDISALNMKEIDHKLDVDPLFHKMRANFDEGGAHGLLLKNLKTDKYDDRDLYRT
eukprot:jgi/Bigna1/81096/fgenesh1_pg.77_\